MAIELRKRRVKSELLLASSITSPPKVDSHPSLMIKMRVNAHILSLLIFIHVTLLVSGLPQPSPHTSAKRACTTHGHKGLLKLHSYTNLEVVNGTALAEGLLSVTDTPEGNKHLTMHFDRCSLPYMTYEQGFSRNSHGSMGAPLEYFGHIRHGHQCLTVQSSVDGPMQPKGLHFTPCSQRVCTLHHAAMQMMKASCRSGSFTRLQQADPLHSTLSARETPLVSHILAPSITGLLPLNLRIRWLYASLDTCCSRPLSTINTASSLVLQVLSIEVEMASGTLVSRSWPCSVVSLLLWKRLCIIHSLNYIRAQRGSRHEDSSSKLLKEGSLT
jgi:hypothetical protein